MRYQKIKKGNDMNLEYGKNIEEDMILIGIQHMWFKFQQRAEDLKDGPIHIRNSDDLVLLESEIGYNGRMAKQYKDLYAKLYEQYKQS
jgi:hypothetical protein